MQLNDLASTGAIHIRWPTIVNGERVGPSDLRDSDTCRRKCGENPKCRLDKSIGEHVCEFGLSYFVYQLPDNAITVFGLRGPNNPTRLNTYTKAGLKGRSVALHDLDEWLVGLRLLIEKIEKTFLLRQAEMLDPLHDPMRIAKQIGNIAKRLIQQQSQGSSLDDQIDNASSELKSLTKAADLLADSFDLLTIYFNPEAASFGTRGAVSLHGLLAKLVHIFRIDDGGLTRHTSKIYLKGNCYRNAFVYESFKLVPFALIANAVKYSLNGNINVSIEDKRQTIEVTVESVGPYIEEDERSKIFEKRGRGKWAEKMSAGRGVGLYLSAIIAKAHGFQIRVASRKTGDYHEAVPLAVNRFSFEITPLA